MKKILFLLMTFLLSSCATSFIGDAHITPRQCEKKCSIWGLTMSGMVAMGEYSDACICNKKSAENPAMSMSTSSIGPAAVGVVKQMRRAAEQQFSQKY